MTRAIIDKASEKIGIRINANCEFIQFHSTIAMCKAGIRAAILPDAIVKHFKPGKALYAGTIGSPALNQQIIGVRDRLSLRQFGR